MSHEEFSNVCSYYNPYFQDDCEHGEECTFDHLSHEKYLEFIAAKHYKHSYDSESVYYFKSALHKFHSGKCRISSKMFESLISTDPHNAQYNLYSARAFEKLGSYDSAEYYYRKSICIQPGNATFYGRYATFLHMKLSKFEESVFFYETALNIRDDINAIHCHYAKLLFDYFENYEMAEKHFKRCLQIFADDEECHFYYGQLLYKLNKYESAEYHFKKALCLQNKPYIWHHYYFALVCIELKNYDTAKQQLQICLDYQHQPWASIHFQYGLLIYFMYNSPKIGLKHLLIAKNADMNTSSLNKIYQKIKHRQIIKNEINYIKYRSLIKGGKKEKEKEKEENKEESASISPCSRNPSPIDFYLDNDDLFSDNETFQIVQSVHDEIRKEQEQEIKEPNLPKICGVQNEFMRFLKDIDLENYYNKFADESINDIRLIQHIDDKFLHDTGMNNDEIKLYRKKANTLIKNTRFFVKEWKESNIFLYNLFFNAFERNGVLTFESFFYYFQKPNDILSTINIQQDQAKLIWNIFQKNSNSKT